MVWGQASKGSEGGSKGNWCGASAGAASSVAVRTPPLTVGQVSHGGTLPCDAVGPAVEDSPDGTLPSEKTIGVRAGGWRNSAAED